LKNKNKTYQWRPLHYPKVLKKPLAAETQLITQDWQMEIHGRTNHLPNANCQQKNRAQEAKYISALFWTRDRSTKTQRKW